MTAVPDLVTPTWEYAPAPEARDVVTIEPSRIEVIGRRSTSIFDTLADWLPKRGGAS